MRFLAPRLALVCRHPFHQGAGISHSLSILHNGFKSYAVISCSLRSLCRHFARISCFCAVMMSFCGFAATAVILVLGIVWQNIGCLYQSSQAIGLDLIMSCILVGLVTNEGMRYEVRIEKIYHYLQRSCMYRSHQQAIFMIWNNLQGLV